jgi:hypothetical protein
MLDAQLLPDPATHCCWWRADLLLQGVAEVPAERHWQILPLLLCKAACRAHCFIFCQAHCYP